MKLNEELMKMRLANFHPESLIDNSEQQHFNDENIETLMVEENDDDNVDLAKANYLNLLDNLEIKKEAEATIRIYGMGTCGPQTFYGTTDLHEELERKLAKFLHKDESIVFSYGFMALSSTITAYCKLDDVVFADELTNTPIQHGLNLSRSHIVKFSHNSPSSFAQAVNRIMNSERKWARRFLVLEGVSWTTGQLCPLMEFVEIAEKYKIRVFLDETYTVGVFGRTGRGLLEHYKCDPTRVDVIFGALEGALGSVGGFSAASSQLILQLKLCGVGWLFSASIPTYLVAVVLKALDCIGDLPEMLKFLAVRMHWFLVEKCEFEVRSHPEAPFKLFTTKNKDLEVYNYCKSNGVYFIRKQHGLMINLNVKLLAEINRFDKVCRVLEQASKLFK